MHVAKTSFWVVFKWLESSWMRHCSCMLRRGGGGGDASGGCAWCGSASQDSHTGHCKCHRKRSLSLRCCCGMQDIMEHNRPAVAAC